MDCLTRWILLLRKCMASSRSEKETRPVFKFFRCSNDYIMKKVYFSQLMRVCVGSIMLAACTQSRFPCFGQQGLVDFFKYRPWLPIGWRIVQILRQRRGKTTNTAPTTLSTIQASSQSTFAIEQSYCQRKLALTAINKLFSILKSQESLKNLKTSRVPWLGLVL